MLSTNTNDEWLKIVTEAVNRGIELSSGGVPGTKLRKLISEVAPKYGKKYPPEEYPNEKFGDFLERFRSAIIILRREGQDFLVAPADKPELLASVHAGKPAGLRDDIFEAFTRIPREIPPVQPWYSRELDNIQWISETDSLNSAGLVKIPPQTQQQEIDDRIAFAELAEMQAHRSILLSTLGEHTALWAYSKIIKERGLGRNWHLYRFQSIIRRIKAWCGAEGVKWHDDWIRQTAGQPIPARDPYESTASQTRRQLFIKLTEIISDEDLQRISVPLDIVLKFIK
jgi:hypothetical protein